MDIIGLTEKVKDVVKRAMEFASLDFPVLITGETGTGKELIARTLHYSGPRRSAPFLSVNCAALPKELTESELFGHEKGAFTGASQRRGGAFEEVQNGTLFLDEIGDMVPASQAALLRVMDTGEYLSVGGARKTTQARIVLATNQDLETLIQEGKFRKDLFYRLDRMRIHLPPLRERQDDIKILVRHFLETLEKKIGKGVNKVSDEVISLFNSYSWPGNVRELKNEIERAYIYATDDTVRSTNLSSNILVVGKVLSNDDTQSSASVEEIYKLVEALKASGGNISKAARIIGVHRNTIHRWINKHALQALVKE